MTVAAKPAHYTPASLDAFSGNPLIEALPDFLKVRPLAICEKLAQQPERLAEPA